VSAFALLQTYSSHSGFEFSSCACHSVTKLWESPCCVNLAENKPPCVLTLLTGVKG